jgi:transposase
MIKIGTQINTDLKLILKNKLTPQVLKRMAIILLYLLEINVKKISEILKCSEKTTYNTIKKYESFGAISILEKPRSGRKSLLNYEEITELKNELNSNKLQNKVSHIDLINDIVEKNKGKRFSRSGLYAFSKRNGIRKVKRRSIQSIYQKGK